MGFPKQKTNAQATHADPMDSTFGGRHPLGCECSPRKEAILYFFKKEMDLAPQYGYCLTTTMPYGWGASYSGENRKTRAKAYRTAFS